MDNVNNRSLFRRKSQAARDKVRQMGMVREPQGILASFPELMMAAGRGRPMMQQPQPMMQQPVQLQNGGDIALEAFQQGAPEPSLGAQIAANPALAAVQPVDITATPTPRERVEVPDIATMVRANLGDNPEAQEKFSQLEGALTDPETSAEDRQKAITDAAGVENTKDGLRSVVSQITGREQPASATVDELNRAITGVALGGAIGGPRSVAERISNALLVGLQAQRETAVGRERFEQEVRVAAAGRGRGTGRGVSPMEPYNDAVLATLRSIMTNNPGMSTDEAMEAAKRIVDPLYQQAASGQTGGAAPVQEAVGQDGKTYYSQDGINYFDAQGNPYVEPPEGE